MAHFHIYRGNKKQNENCQQIMLRIYNELHDTQDLKRNLTIGGEDFP